MTAFTYNKPIVGGSEDAWGNTLNANWDALGAFIGDLDSADLSILAGSAASGVLEFPTLSATLVESEEFQGTSSDSVTSPSFTWTSDTNTGMYRPSANVIGFTTGGEERVRVTNTGAVGIGTTSPTEKLHVNGKIRLGSQATATTDAVRADRTITAGTGLSGGGDLTGNLTLSITNGGVGSTQLSSDQRMTIANVLSKTAGADFAEVGSTALLRAVGGGALSRGSTISGGNLSAATVAGTPLFSGGVITVQSGTWRCMGITTESGELTTASRPNQTTLFLRIS